MRSIRFFSRARTSERGFALALAVVLALLYFGLIELLMIDASQQLAEARRFRARIVSLTLAENGAEMAALGITNPHRTLFQIAHEDTFGKASGKMFKTGEKPGSNPGLPRVGFTIQAEGRASGVVGLEAKVVVTGEVQGHEVRIDYTDHTQ